MQANSTAKITIGNDKSQSFNLNFDILGKNTDATSIYGAPTNPNKKKIFKIHQLELLELI